MEEKVLVVLSELYTAKYGENSTKIISADYDDFSNFVENNSSYMIRSSAENNPQYKQIVSYCMIRYKDEVFVTKRTKKQTETRLHEKWSVGIGGHINNLDNTNNQNTISVGCIRELNEEISIGAMQKVSFFGIINDNSSEVSSVHSGVCFIIELPTRKCSIKETEKMTGEWITIDQLKKDYYENLEGWSKIFLDSIR